MTLKPDFSQNKKAIEYETNVVDSNALKDPILLPGEEIKLPLEDEKLKELQQKDKLCKEIIEKLSKGQLQNGMDNPIIKRRGYSKGLWKMVNKDLKL